MAAENNEITVPVEIVVRDYLLDDEVRLLDAWYDPAIADTYFSSGVDSMREIRKRHGRGAKAAERAAVEAYSKLSSAGGTYPSMQANHGPDWAWAALRAPCPAAPAPDAKRTAHDTGDGWHLCWADEGDGVEIPWPFGDVKVSADMMRKLGFEVV